MNVITALTGLGHQILDNVEPRTRQSRTLINFRQWCEDVLKPAVLA